jgi:hypothetical protein
MSRAAELAVVLAVVAAAFASTAGPARAIAEPAWSARIEAAEQYVGRREGWISFALLDEAGRMRGHRSRAAVPTASLLKPMLLVAYLRMPSVRGRGLTPFERSVLGPMIRRSDNGAVATMFPRVGAARMYALARLAGMERFRLAWPVWGLSQTTARDQARFFYRIDRLVPKRHRAYALELLRTIVPWQRWGVGRVAHPGWRLYFKGGWGSGTGLVDHQVALLKTTGGRIAVAITTRFNPDHAYGKRTLRGLAARLVGRVPVPLAHPGLR